MPRGGPEKLDGTPEIGASHSVNAGNGNRQMRCPEYYFSQPKERQQERDLRGIHEVIDELGGRKIQAENQGGERAKRRGPAQRGKHAEDHAQRQAERQLFCRDTLTQQIQDRKNQPAIEEAFFHATFWRNSPATGSSGFSSKSCNST